MKLTTMTQVTLDGVMQGNGAASDDRRNGFERGGWARGAGDEETRTLITQTYQRAEAFLFGRRTYELFAGSWGSIDQMRAHPIGVALNEAPKYVASTTLTAPRWADTTVLRGDLAAAISELKAKPGGELQVHGSGALLRWLLENDLVEEMTLIVVPVVLGDPGLPAGRASTVRNGLKHAARRRRGGTVVVVLVWINGPFGGGKTATAFELQRRLAGSVVCDPEHLGFGLHRMLPPSLRTDFQSFQAWRSGVREVLDLAARKQQGPIIVPMTLIDRRYFAEIIGRLGDDGHDVRHFALLAERDTVLRRLNRRGFGFGLRHERWAVSHLDDCLEQLRRPEFAEHIHTDQQTVPQIADTIARLAALPIRPDTDGPLRGSLRRYATTLRHVRLD